MKLPRTTPQERVIRKSKLKETFVTVMGEISVRPVVHGLILSGPDVTSMVMTMKVMVMMALMMMPVRAMLVMAMTMRPRPLGPMHCNAMLKGGADGVHIAYMQVVRF